MEASNLASAMGLTETNLAVIKEMDGSIESLAMTAIINGVDVLPYLAENGLEVTLDGQWTLSCGGIYGRISSIFP